MLAMILIYNKVSKSTTQGPRQKDVLNRDKMQYKAEVLNIFLAEIGCIALVEVWNTTKSKDIDVQKRMSLQSGQ